MPRGTEFWGSNNLRPSSLPSARKVSWELHHDGLYPLGDILSEKDTLGSDPTCPPELRFGGCPSCNETECQAEQKHKTCEFNQPCPLASDPTTAAKLGGNGALATHMVRKISWFSSVFLGFPWFSLVLRGFPAWYTHGGKGFS